MCIPESEDEVDESWTDDDDDGSGYWDLICSLLSSLETESLTDRLQALEVVRIALSEWLDVFSDDTEPPPAGDYFDFEYAEFADYDAAIEIVPAPAALTVEEDHPPPQEVRPAQKRDTEPGMREQARR
jgi:hypothetical protein